MWFEIALLICAIGIVICFLPFYFSGENYRNKQRNKLHNWQYDLNKVWIPQKSPFKYDLTYSLRVCRDCGLMQAKVYADLYSWKDVYSVEEYERRIKEVNEEIQKCDNKYQRIADEKRKVLERVVKR